MINPLIEDLVAASKTMSPLAYQKHVNSVLNEAFHLVADGLGKALLEPTPEGCSARNMLNQLSTELATIKKQVAKNNGANVVRLAKLQHLGLAK